MLFEKHHCLDFHFKLYECGPHIAALCWYWQLLPLSGAQILCTMLRCSVWYNPKGLRIENVMIFLSDCVETSFHFTLRYLDHQVLKISVVLWFMAQNQSDVEMFIVARPWQYLDWLECFVACAPPAFYVHTRPWGHCGLVWNQWSYIQWWEYTVYGGRSWTTVAFPSSPLSWH